MNFRKFEGTRARLQRLSDAKIFSCWIKHVDDQAVKIQLNGLEQANQGDQFFIQAFGDGQIGLFKAELVSSEASLTTLRRLSELQLTMNSEEVRVLVSGVRCHIRLGWFEAWGDVLDLSPSGIGVRFNSEIEKGQIADLELVTPSGDIRLRGEIKYCRTIDGMYGLYRAGIELIEPDKLNAVKWNRFVDSCLGEIKAA